MELLVIVGARPNLPKAWALLSAIAESSPQSITAVRLVSIGQHISGPVWEPVLADLALQPELWGQPPLAGESDAGSLGRLMTTVGDLLASASASTSIVCAIGDVNTAVAAAVVAARLGFPVVHLEAGLRSRIHDPEETNRRLITASAHAHLCTTDTALQNLAMEGVASDRCAFTGNPMAYTWIRHAEARRASTVLDNLKLESGGYILTSIHKALSLSLEGWHYELLAASARCARRQGLRWCVLLHPHTEQRLPAPAWDLLESERALVTRGMGYVDHGRLVAAARTVITDSAGTQEEAAVERVPCLAVGPAVARPDIFSTGTVRFVGFDTQNLAAEVESLIQSAHKGFSIFGWDDHLPQRLETAFARLIPLLTQDAQPQWRLRPPSNEKTA